MLDLINKVEYKLKGIGLLLNRSESYEDLKASGTPSWPIV